MNMDLQRGLSAYRQTAARQPQTKNVVVLLDGVLRHLDAAKIAHGEGRMPECLGRIGKATGILAGLQGQLRLDVDPDFVATQRRYYGGCILSISRLVSRRFPPRTYGALVRHLTQYRNAWATIAGVAERGADRPPDSPAPAAADGG